MRRRDGSLFPGIRHERRYTTTELLVTEQRIIEQAIAGGAGPMLAGDSKLISVRANNGTPFSTICQQHHRHATLDPPSRVPSTATDPYVTSSDV